METALVAALYSNERCIIWLLFVADITRAPIDHLKDIILPRAITGNNNNSNCISTQLEINKCQYLKDLTLG